MQDSAQTADERARQRQPASPEEEIASIQNTEIEIPTDYFAAGLIATGLAAATVAALTSLFGAGGTLWGAVMGAMIGSTASQVAKPRLARIEHRVRRRLSKLKELGVGGAVGVIVNAPVRAVELVRQVPKPVLASTAALAVSGLAVGLISVTLVELVEGRPLSAIVAGDQTETGTTVGTLVNEAPNVVRPGPPPDSTTAKSPAGGTPSPVASPGAAGSDNELGSSVRASGASPIASPEVESRTAAEPAASPEIRPTVTLTPTTTPTPRATITATPTSSPSPAPVRTATALPPVPTPGAAVPAGSPTTKDLGPDQ